jgi:hypothetical protein
MKITIKPMVGMDEEKGETQKDPEEHEVAHWADTLLKAEDIKSDPHKMKHVDAHLAKKTKAIRSVADLRKRAKTLKVD